MTDGAAGAAMGGAAMLGSEVIDCAATGCAMSGSATTDRGPAAAAQSAVPDYGIRCSAMAVQMMAAHAGALEAAVADCLEHHRAAALRMAALGSVDDGIALAVRLVPDYMAMRRNSGTGRDEKAQKGPVRKSVPKVGAAR